jgi:AcrR family transcriptional regulator
MALSKRMHSADRRAVIVRQAVRLFAERGFRGATTRELAAAVGVTEPVLYEHFRTKRELYEAIVEAKSREGRDRFAALAGSHLEAGDDQGFFEGLADLVLGFHESNPDYIRLLMFSALEGHELGEMFYRRHREVFFGPVTEYIERRVRARAFRKVDALLAARAFSGMVSHIGLYSVLLPEIVPKMDRQDLIHGLVKIFLEGVTRRKKAPAKKRKQ